MRSKCILDINQKYWIFFCMVSIVPFIGISVLLLKNLNFRDYADVQPTWMLVFLQENQFLEPVAFFIILCFLITVGALFKRNIIKPVISLANVTKKLVEEDDDEFKSRINIASYCNNEIAIVVDSFNSILDRLDETEQLRSAFITTLTHDLRTPILAQQRVIEILDNEIQVLPLLEQKRLIAGLLENNNNLLTLVNIVLETYQYEKGNIILDYKIVSLHNMVNECLFELKTLAESNYISLINNLGYNIPFICADPRHLKRVFNNLVGNAIQNIPKDRMVEISGELQKDFVEIRVRDNGQGIPQTILPDIFKRYSSGHRLRKKIGSGLGLYICKMIVEMHEGTIRVESDPNQGTSFYIRLPLVNPCCYKNKYLEGEQWKARCHNCKLKSIENITNGDG